MHTSQLRNPQIVDEDSTSLPAADDHPLLNPEIIDGVLFHLEGDLRSLGQNTRTCRLWWHVGHHRVWRSIQLRDLLGYVKDLSRKQYFASLVETITFKSGDNVLARGHSSIPLLDFERLAYVKIHGSNLDGLRTENIMSLIVPSLRSWVIEESMINRKSGHEANDITAMRVLSTAAATLRTLDIDGYCYYSLGPVVWEMLDSLTALERLHFRYIGEILHQSYHPEVFLRKILTNKPSLVAVGFTHGVDFDERDIDNFLAWTGRDWSLPSLREFGRPTFNSVPAATKLIERMPNVEELIFSIDDRFGNFMNDVKDIFTFMSTIRQMVSVDLDLSGLDCGLDGSWLVQLGTLKDLEILSISLYRPRIIAVTAAQLICFLTSLPKLRYLAFRFDGVDDVVDVPCSAEEKTVIESAIARIGEVHLHGMTFTVQQPT